MFNDPISDMLTRIRNALLVKKPEVRFPFSKVKWNIAKILKESGYIESFDKIKSYRLKGSSRKMVPANYEEIVVHLKYDAFGESSIRQLKRVSKPGRRVYVKKDRIPVVLNNLGMAIISTPEGLMSNQQARKKGLGGEVMCEIF